MNMNRLSINNPVTMKTLWCPCSIHDASIRTVTHYLHAHVSQIQILCHRTGHARDIDTIDYITGIGNGSCASINTIQIFSNPRYHAGTMFVGL
jgi:hypothetical protein